MFELPEYLTLARQANAVLPGKVIGEGRLGNQAHKFVWYNRTHDEFAALTAGLTVGEACTRGKWLFIDLNPGYRLVFGECGGAIRYHAETSTLPGKYHLWLRFADGSTLSALTQMWGAMELYEQGREANRQYILGMRPTPADASFTQTYFAGLVAESAATEKRTAKGLLTQDQLIPGLGNAIAQDILWEAQISPRHPLGELAPGQVSALYRAIMTTVAEVTACGGRYDEVDLFGQPGGYVRRMDKNTVGRPCRRCGETITKVQYLGGSCYFCPGCQR